MAFWGLVGVISFPSKMMVPASLWLTPVRHLMRVDLPAPFSPSSAWEEIHPVQRLYAGELDLYAPHFEYVFRQCNSSFIETMGNWE